jgi:uncharacterized protein
LVGSGVGAGHRVVAWNKDGMAGAEFAVVDFCGDGLRAEGSAIGFEPVPYRLEYKLVAESRLVTGSVVVVVRGDGWGRQLDLVRAGDGTWSARVEQRGTVDLADAGGDVAALAGALDVDLGLSPLFNTMPVLRHRLHDGGGPADFLMAWISVPALSLHPSPQRYTHLERRSAGERVVRFEATGEGEAFVADVVFDADGLVIDYPGLAARFRGGQGV